MGNSSGGVSTGGGGWGAIASALIGAGTSYYAGKEQEKAVEEANAKQAEAMQAAQDKQNKYMEDATARQNKLVADRDRAANEANIPIGESASIDLTGGQDESYGSAADFLIPKIGKSQLGGASGSGLGV